MTRAADDFAAISAASKALRITELTARGVCLIRTSATSAGCWCIGAGPGGSNAPCPPREEEATKTPAAPEPFRLPPQTRVPWFGRSAATGGAKC